MARQKVAMLTAGGLAPCLSSAVGGLIERYSDVAPDVELIAYKSGYQGVLLGDSVRDQQGDARKGSASPPLWRLADRQQPS